MRERALLAAKVAEIADPAQVGASAAARAAERARRVDVAQAPLLIETTPGRAFLRSPAKGRAFAMGAPAASCPAIGLSTDAKTPMAAAEAALGACFEALDAAPRLLSPDVEEPAACGCRLIAVSGALLAGISAYLCIHYFIALVERTGMLPYVIYRLVLGAGLLSLIYLF